MFDQRQTHGYEINQWFTGGYRSRITPSHFVLMCGIALVASDIENSLGHQERKGNVLFNDTLNTFYLRLYGIGLIVKDHSDSERGNPLSHMGYSFRLWRTLKSNRVLLLC